MPTLTFVETHRYNYPVPTVQSGPQYGSTALTITRLNGDIALAFLTQTQYDDEVVYLKPCCDIEFMRHVTPPGRHQISGMGFNPITGNIWCGSHLDPDRLLVFAFEPGTGQQTLSRDLTGIASGFSGQGFATNGLFMARGSYETMELFGMGGAKVGEKTYSGRRITGISASPWSWTFVDEMTNEIVVINPFGQEIATAPGVGSAGGMAAIAFDTLSEAEFMPQLYDATNCNLGDPGTLYHYDTDWSPTPWHFRHRIYVANNVDQLIYAGYLTA